MGVPAHDLHHTGQIQLVKCLAPPSGSSTSGTLSRMRISILALAVLVLLICMPGTASAEEMVVGVKPAPPFVIRSAGDAPSGFSVDLIREIAARMDPPRSVRFTFADDLPTHLADVADGKVDLGIAATNITAEREEKVDFSTPFFPDALDIAVRERDEAFSLWAAIENSGVLNVMLGLLLFVLVTAHVVWIAERGNDAFDRHYAKGIGQAVWWTIVTMSTVGYGDFVPKTGIGRGLGVIVIFAGIVMFGVAVASLTAAATAQRLESSISGVSDLAGMRVVALPGSVGAAELRRRDIRPESVASTAAGLEAVRAGDADAFVHDRSQLLYALSEAPSGVVLVNRPFKQQNYAIAFPLGSPLRKEVNIAFHRLTEDGDKLYDMIRERWFPGS